MINCIAIAPAAVVQLENNIAGVCIGTRPIAQVACRSKGVLAGLIWGVI